ncbi:MAG: CPBP family intramembrane metalloprotease [Chitinophagaceae bacterium]|nr:MAG: CPBP family intramembrane metalloprotease [Chitinophagaceae bacterium]
MYDNDSKGFSYTGAFFMLIAFTVAGLIAASLLSVPIWQLLTGRPFSEMQAGMLDPANSDVMKLMQAVTAIVGFLLPTIATAALIHKKPLSLLGFRGRITAQQAGLAILIIVAALFFSSSLSQLTRLIPIPSEWAVLFEKMEADYTRQVSAIVSLKSFGDYLIALVVMAFLPALCEEAVFRGGLQNFLTRGMGSPWLAIIVVSVLFSLAHVSFYGFLSRFMLGMVLGALYHYSGRLWLSILAHFINNAIALTALYIYTKQGQTMEQAMTDGPANLWGLLAIPVLVLLIISYRRASMKKLARPY